MKIGENFLSNIEPLNTLNRNQNSQPQEVSTTQFSNFLASALNQLLLGTETQANDSTSVNSDPLNMSIGNMMGNNMELGSLMANTGLNSSALYSLIGSLATYSDVPGSNFNSNLLNSSVSNLANDFQIHSNQSLSFNSISSEKLDQVLSGKLKGMGQVFCQAGQLFNVDPALLAAITQHETGNGKSQAANEKNNVAGMMGAGGLKSYPSVEASIMDMAKNISNNYLGKGLSNISEIGAKYAPIGASNDPTGLNNYWVNGVTKYYNQLRIQY
jgi:hypothetical protein